MGDPGSQLVSKALDSAQISHAKDFMTDEATLDFALITGDGQKVKVHKAILGLKSPVFAAMFS